MKRFVTLLIGLGLGLGLGLEQSEAETLDVVVAAKLAPALPGGLGIAHVYLPASMAGLDVEAAAVIVEMPREVHAGRASVRVSVRGKKTREGWVQISYAAVAEVAGSRRALAAGDVIATGDVSIERRAVDGVATASAGSVVGATLTRDLPAGTPVGAHDVVPAPPLPRGTQVTVDVRRGNVHVHGAGTLELAARPGQSATVRLANTKTTVRGTLVAPATVEIGDAP